MQAAVSILNEFEAMKWQKLGETTTSDLLMQNPIEIIEDGFPISKREMIPQLQDQVLRTTTNSGWHHIIQGLTPHPTFLATGSPFCTPCCPPRSHSNECQS